MKTLRGKQKLGEMAGSDVLIDWDFIEHGHGLRSELDDFQKTLGRFLRMVGIAAILALSASDLTLGNNLFSDVLHIDRNIDLVFWVAVGMIIYSMYLLRDRVAYVDTLEIKSLDHLRDQVQESHIPKQMELCDYFDFDLLSVFDDLIRENDKYFINNLISHLVSLPDVKLMITRLGIEPSEFDKINKRVSLSINTSRDTWIEKLLFESFTLAYTNNFRSIDEKVMFLVVCAHPLKEVLLEFGIFPAEINGLILWSKNEALKARYKKLWREKASLKPKNTVNRSFTSKFATTLEQFKRDFTLEVITGAFTFSIARENELNEMVRLLHQGDKGAVLMVGAGGVGKTTLLKSLALKMVVEDVPANLADMRLIGFDFFSAYASTSDVEKFRSVVDNVFKDVQSAGNIILVIDDFDQIVNLKSEVSGEIISLLLKALDEYNIRVLATSSEIGYFEHIKPNKAIMSSFDMIKIDEPTDDVAIQILIDMVTRLEAKYRLKISFDAIKKSVELAHKYAFDRVLPEKAIDLLEEACVFVNEQGVRFVSDADIEELVSRKVGVHVGAIGDEERGRLAHMEEIMHKRVIGQDQAITSISKALRRSRAGLNKENKPVASFLFFGPTGVGKTEVAKTLAASYYGSEDQMIRLDMSEYQEDENLGRLLGYREGDDFYGGYLTESVREKPFSIVLLDELEKANPKVLDIFLQILDEGHVTDGIGRDVNFTNTIIIATSNTGSKELSKLLLEGVSYAEAYQKVSPILRDVFRVEFLNRFDQVIMFKPLSQDEIAQIAGLLMNSLAAKLYEKGIRLEYKPELLVELSTIGYDPVFGARELKRVVQEEVEDRIATLMIDDKLKNGDRLVINSLNNIEVN